MRFKFFKKRGVTNTSDTPSTPITPPVDDVCFVECFNERGNHNTR